VLFPSLTGRMTLNQLRIFEAVARHCHFTRAAEELYLSQPSVSVQVRELEKECGTFQLVRHPRKRLSRAAAAFHALLLAHRDAEQGVI